MDLSLLIVGRNCAHHLVVVDHSGWCDPTVFETTESFVRMVHSVTIEGVKVLSKQEDLLSSIVRTFIWDHLADGRSVVVPEAQVVATVLLAVQTHTEWDSLAHHI